MKRELIPIALIVFVDVLGFTIVIPLLPFYVERFGASPAVVGLVLSLYAICSLIAAPMLGRWSDRIGRKPVLLLSQAGTLLGFIMLALAPTIAWVFAARAIDGLTAGNVATARAYIADITTVKERTAAFGVIAAAFGFGYLLGPAGAGFLARFGDRTPIWVAAAISSVSILTTLLVLPISARLPSASRAPVRFFDLMKIPGMAARMGQLLAFLTAFSCFTAGFALFCERRLVWAGTPFGVTQVGFALAYIGLLGLIAQLVVLRPLVHYIGEQSLAYAAISIGAIAYAALALVHDVPALIACLTGSAIANSLLRPALLGLVSLRAPVDQQGAINGLTQSMQYIAMVGGPLLAGALIEDGRLTAWALSCASILACALVPQLKSAR